MNQSRYFEELGRVHWLHPVDGGSAENIIADFEDNGKFDNDCSKKGIMGAFTEALGGYILGGTRR